MFSATQISFVFFGFLNKGDVGVSLPRLRLERASFEMGGSWRKYDSGRIPKRLCYKLKPSQYASLPEGYLQGETKDSPRQSEIHAAI